MCSWCWAYRPTLLLLRSNLPDAVTWNNVLGGLAPDNDQPMPEQTRQMIIGHWRQIEASLGTPFNFDFWTKNQPRRDTYKACRAVIAAACQQAEESMIESIQKAYYLRALNPAELVVLADLAEELGLNRSRFMDDLNSKETEASLRSQLSKRDQLMVRSFPSLVLEHRSAFTRITHDYQDYRTSLVAIQKLLF